MTAQADFEKNFHSISGITISERRKNLYQLLNSAKIIQNEIDFASVIPKTALEDVFKVETLLFFRKTDDLLKVLCGDNSVLIQRVLNASDWFINSAFENINGEELVTKIFSNISYNTKLKLLNKIAKFSPSVHKSDEYFEAVKNNYGLFLATKLLESCSEQLILQCIENYRVEITPGQLLMIVKKNPKITENILELLEKQNYKTSVNIKYKSVFLYLSQNDSVLFLKLFDKYTPELSFGTRRTKSFILQNRTYVINNSKRWYKMLKFGQIYKNIQVDFEKFLYNMFPKSLQKFPDVFLHVYRKPLMQKSLPKAKQFYLLTNLFKKVYEEEIWNFPNFVTSELLELMSPDDREVWMQNHTKPNGWKEETWISLMKTEKAIPWLIEKISLTFNVANRKRLIMALVSTCHLNNDLDALLGVLEYLAKNHRNYDVNMRERFLNLIGCLFDLQTFSEEHWMYFMKLVRSFLIDNNFMACTILDSFDEYISYRYLHKFDIYDLVLEWVKQRTHMYNLGKKIPECEKLCLRIIAEVLPKVFVQKCDLDGLYRSYLSDVHDYNERNPKDRMSFFENPNAIQSMKEELQYSDSFYRMNTDIVLKACLKFEFRLSLETGLVEEYFKRRKDQHDCLFSSLLKNCPETFATVVLPHLERRCSLYDLHFLKYYEHLEIPQKFVQSKTSIDADSLKPDDIQCLSHTMKPNHFLTLIAAYFRKDLMDSCDIETEEKFYKLQKVAILSLKNLISPGIALPCLLNFCQGDYLKLSVGSLHLLCENLSENKIMDFVNVLNNPEVSVRKHSIYLAFRLLNKKTLGEFVGKLLQNEENMSIRKCILNATFKLFLNTQEQSDIELVKKYVKAIDLEDTKAYTIITNNVKKVSPKYFKEFILFIWDILENVQNPDKAIVRGKCRILSAINEWNIGSLPTEFCSRLLEKYLFKSKKYDKLEARVEAFASKYIIHHNLQKFEHRIRLVLSIAQTYVQSNWYNNMEMCTNGRLFISKFVVEFSKSFMSKKCKNVNIIESFLKIWKEMFPPWMIYNEFLHLSFTLLYVKSIEQNFSMLEIGESLGKLCNDFHSEENLNVIVFCRVFETFKSHFESIFIDEDPNECCLLMAEGILTKNITSSGFMLAMFLLPDVDELTRKNREKCKSIFNLIVRRKESNVRIFVHQEFLSKVSRMNDSSNEIYGSLFDNIYVKPVA